jgi:hypothetical protein
MIVPHSLLAMPLAKKKATGPHRIDAQWLVAKDPAALP